MATTTLTLMVSVGKEYPRFVPQMYPVAVGLSMARYYRKAGKLLKVLRHPQVVA